MLLEAGQATSDVAGLDPGVKRLAARRGDQDTRIEHSLDGTGPGDGVGHKVPDISEIPGSCQAGGADFGVSEALSHGRVGGFF